MEAEVIIVEQRETTETWDHIIAIKKLETIIDFETSVAFVIPVD